MAQGEKKFVGSGKEKTFDNGGSLINISIKKSDLEKCNLTEKGYYYLTVATKREPDQYGNTHMVYENDYQKKESTDSGKEELLG